MICAMTIEKFSFWQKLNMQEEQNDGEGATANGEVDVKTPTLPKPAFDTFATVIDISNQNQRNCCQ